MKGRRNAGVKKGFSKKKKKVKWFWRSFLSFSLHTHLYSSGCLIALCLSLAMKQVRKAEECRSAGFSGYSRCTNSRFRKKDGRNMRSTCSGEKKICF